MSDPDPYKFGLPANANDETRSDFASVYTRLYKNKDWSGETLSEYFAEDFKSFTRDNFAALPPIVKRDLRDLLREKGVYVPKGRNVIIADALRQVVETDIPWPREEKPESEEDQSEKGRKDSEDLKPVSQTDDSEGKENAKKVFNLSNLMKAYYKDEDRYAGLPTENLDRKLALFNERCEQMGISDEEKPRAYSIMLRDLALQHYFDALQGRRLKWAELIKATRQRFIAPEHTRNLIREWDATTLHTVMSNKRDKTPTECLEFLVSRLQDIQSSLPQAYKSEEILHNKLLNAVKNVEACKLAYFKPADTLSGLINDLHASLAASSTPILRADAVQAMFVDRKFKSNLGSRKKKCLVCHRDGCWSTNHSPKERIKALRKNKAFRQFLTDVQQDSSEDEENVLANELENISAHILEPDDIVGVQDKDVSGSNAFCVKVCDVTSADNNEAFLAFTRDSAVSHALSAEVPEYHRYTEDFFFGLLIDTGCARASSGGYAQYRAYCRHVGQPEDIDTKHRTNCRFGISATTSRGTATLLFPLNHLTFKVKIHIINDDIPLLLSLADMDRMGVFYNNIEDKLIHQESGESVTIERFYDHPFLHWNPIIACLFTETELRRLHRRFGHPKAEKLYSILKRSELANITGKTRGLLEKITRRCEPCQKHSSAPLRFKFTLREDKEFNHTVFVDIFYIEKKPVLHVVDESTRYQAARWLPDVTADSVWRALRMCWIDVYLGPPDVVTHDAGKQFMARVFQANAELLHIETKAVPVESSNSMSFVERYHGPVRRAFKIIKSESPDLSEDEILQMAVKSINDSVGPDGLVPSLLVYGALPRLGLPTDKPTPNMFQRAIALRKATQEVTKHFSRTKVSGALRARNGPDTNDIRNAPVNTPVLVYRPEIDMWDGVHRLQWVDGEDCYVLLPPPSGLTKFRSTVVKRYLQPEPSAEDEGTLPALAEPLPVRPNKNESVDRTAVSRIAEGSQSTQNTSLRQLVNSSTVSAFKMTISGNQNNNGTELIEIFKKQGIPQSDDHKKYEASRMKEFVGLVERGVFTPVHKSEAGSHRVFGSRFVDHVKHEGTPNAYEKSRLVVQGFNDKSGVLTHEPTVQRASQRLQIALCASDPDLQIFMRDVSQAYVQSSTKIKRPIFVKPPSVLGYSNDLLFRVNCPLYGIPEAGNHWFFTYHNYHTETLKMVPSVYDPCLHYTKESMSISSRSRIAPRGMVCLQTDDTAYAGNKEFRKLEEKVSRRFDSKKVEVLRPNTTLKCNGGLIHFDGSSYTVKQPNQVQKMSTLDPKSFTAEDFISERARGSYISAVCRPEVSYAFSIASQVIQPMEQDVKNLNKAIDYCRQSPDSGLRFVPLDVDSVTCAVFVDAGFATNADLSSQLGFIIVLMDKHSRVNVVHYGSLKSKRITRSVLAAELFAMVYGFDVSSTIRIAINDILSRVVPLNVYTDSRSLFDCLTKISRTAEKRLLIDLCMLRQSYERREITEVFWIPTEQNPADGFTKSKPCIALQKMLETNKLELTPNAWVEREVPYWFSKNIREQKTPECRNDK